jgi:hypothetical protein
LSFFTNISGHPSYLLLLPPHLLVVVDGPSASVVHILADRLWPFAWLGPVSPVRLKLEMSRCYVVTNANLKNVEKTDNVDPS